MGARQRARRHPHRPQVEQEGEAGQRRALAIGPRRQRPREDRPPHPLEPLPPRRAGGAAPRDRGRLPGWLHGEHCTRAAVARLNPATPDSVLESWKEIVEAVRVRRERDHQPVTTTEGAGGIGPFFVPPSPGWRFPAVTTPTRGRRARSRPRSEKAQAAALRNSDDPRVRGRGTIKRNPRSGERGSLGVARGIELLPWVLDLRLGRGQAGDRHAERRAADVVHARPGGRTRPRPARRRARRRCRS